MPTANGNPEAANIEECVANCDAVTLRVCNAWVVIFANANLALFSIAIHLTSIQPLYAKNARPAARGIVQQI